MLIHGMSKTKVHQAWTDMKSRCLNKNSTGYHNYGGRGISVCEPWLKFENFYADMGAPADGEMLDRIDVDGDYEPSNCRWVTRLEQMNNMRNTIYLEHDGLRLSIHDWSRKLDIPHETLRGRYRMGWDDSRILTDKVQPMNRLIEHKGERLKIGEWAKRYGLKPTTLYMRIVKGWDIERALKTHVGG